MVFISTIHKIRPDDSMPVDVGSHLFPKVAGPDRTARIHPVAAADPTPLPEQDIPTPDLHNDRFNDVRLHCVPRHISR